MSKFHEIVSNPSFVCPSKILKSIIQVDVDYVDFDGATRLGVIEVNVELAEDIRRFFAEAIRLRFPINRVAPASECQWNDDLLMAANVSSGFNYRLVAGTDLLSLHSYGTAIDINPAQNPYIRYTPEGIIAKPNGTVWNPEAPGTLCAAHYLVELLEELGWEWGGNWSPESGRVDYQHFQKTVLREKATDEYF